MDLSLIDARLLFMLVLILCSFGASIIEGRPSTSTKRSIFDGNLTHLCYPCTPGSISISNCTVLENKTIAQCPNGYCAVEGLYNCSLCLPGSFQNEPHEQKCVPCPYGTFAFNSGAPWCDLCTRGHFCNDTGLTQPYLCQPGFYCPNEGMVEPQLCDPGYTCNGTGLTAPIPCDPGFFCRGGKRGQSPCPAGYYCPGITAEPLKCLWLFQSADLASSCSPSAGFFVIVVLSGVALIVSSIWIFLKLSKRAALKAEQNRSNEITGLIPASTGPTYSGL